MRATTATSNRPLVAFWVGLTFSATGPVLVAASTVHPVAFSVTRLWIGVAVFLATVGVRWLLRRGRLPGQSPRGRWSRVVIACVIGGVLFGLHQVVFFAALRSVNVADVMIMNAVAPVLVALISGRIYGERITRNFWPYATVAIAGTVLIAYRARVEGATSVAGLVLAFLAMVVFTAFFLASRAARAHTSTVGYLAAVFATSAVVVTSYAVLTGVSVRGIDARNLVLAVLVAVVSGGLGVALMTWPLKWLRVSVPPVIRLMQPVLAALLAWMALGQPVSGLQVVGGLITLVGVAGVITDGRFVGALAPRT